LRRSVKKLLQDGQSSSTAAAAAVDEALMSKHGLNQALSSQLQSRLVQVEQERQAALQQRESLKRALAEKE
jgi:hypothetical protein